MQESGEDDIGKRQALLHLLQKRAVSNDNERALRAPRGQLLINLNQHIQILLSRESPDVKDFGAAVHTKPLPPERIAIAWMKYFSVSAMRKEPKFLRVKTLCCQLLL